ILAEPQHEPKVRQGITTELIGIDGNSYAPFHSHDDFLKFVQINSGLDGNPRLPGRWSTVEQYLDMFTRRVAVNIAYVVGNSPLRIGAVGWDNRPTTRDEMANQKALLRTAMQEGAWGMSTGLDYPPGSYADTAELTELSREAARLGGIYHTHVRYSLGDKFLDPFREALDIGRGSDIPVHITHFYHRTTSPGGASRMLGLVEDARDAGLDVTFDSYPYNLSSTRLTILLPQWTHDGGYARLMEVLREAAHPAPVGDGPARQLVGRHVAHQLPKAGQPPLRGPVDPPGRRSTRQGSDRRRVRPARRGRSGDLLRVSRRQPRHVAEVREPSVADGGQRRGADRRLPDPTHVRLLSDHPRRVRAAGAAPATRVRPAEDDLVPGPALRATRPRPAASRLQGRRRRVRRQDGQGAGSSDAAQAVPDRDRLRDRQRPGRHRQRQAHGDAGRPGAAEGPRLDVG